MCDDLESEKTRLEIEIAGLQEDDFTRRQGISVVVAFGLFSILCMAGGATAYMFPADFYWGYTVLGFGLGAAMLLCTIIFGTLWVKKYHRETPPNVALAKRRKRLEIIQGKL